MLTAAGTPAEQLELNKKVTKIVLEHFPKAAVVVDHGNLVAKQGTMIFTVHRRSKTGKVGEKTDQVEGPNYQGFILSISVQDGQYHGAAVVPQTLQRPYWKTYIDRPATKDGKSHFVINFSYGARLNREFISALLEALPNSRPIKAALTNPLPAPELRPDGNSKPQPESKDGSQ